MTNIKKGLSLFLALLTLLTIALSPIGLLGKASADSGGDVLENEDITSEEANNETSAEDIDTNFEFTDIDDSSEADKEKPEAATLGSSGDSELETPAGGPTITPFTTEDFTFVSDGMGPYNGPNVTQYDLATKLSFSKHKNQTLDPEWESSEMGGKSEYNINGDAFNVYALGNNDLGKDIDFTFLGDGRHKLIFRKYATKETDPPNMDTAFVYINIVNTTAVPAVSGTYKNDQLIPVNPTSLTLNHTGATVPDTLAQSGTALTYEWEIVKDSDSTVIESGIITFEVDGKIATGAMPSNDILKGLEIGSYTLKQKSIATTRHGNFIGHGTKFAKGTSDFSTVSWVEVPFIIVKPLPETVISKGGTNNIDPVEASAVISPDGITVNSLHPLNTNSARDNELEASEVTWELFKNINGTWTSQGTKTSFTDGAKTSIVTPPTDFGNYKVVVSETIAGKTDTAEGHFIIPSGHVKVEYYIEDASGSRTPTGTPPATSTGKTGDAKVTDGMTIPHGHELIAVEVKLDGEASGTPVSPLPNNQHSIDYPAHDETTTVIYVYREIPKTNIIVQHMYEDGSPVAVDENFTGYPNDPQATAKLPGYDIVNTKIDGTPLGSTADITANFPATGSTTITYVYKKPPVAKGNVAEKHYIINADGTFTEITGSAHTHPSSNVGKKVTLVGELKGSSLPAGHTYASANTIATNPTGGSVAITGGVVTVVDGQIVVKYYYTAGETVTPPAGQAVVTVTHTLLDINGKVVGVYKTDGKTGKVGEVFSYSQAPLPGYILVAVPGNQNGSLTSSPQTVEYQYKPDPTLASVAEIHYLVDANGKILEVLGASGKTGNNNDPYSYAKMSGYTLVSVTPNATGTLKVGQSPVVIFKYVKTTTVVPPTGSGNTDIWTWITGGSNTVDSSTTPGKDGNTNPQTSDNTNQSYALNILISALVVSLIVLVFVYFLPKKEKRKR